MVNKLLLIVTICSIVGPQSKPIKNEYCMIQNDRQDEHQEYAAKL